MQQQQSQVAQVKDTPADTYDNPELAYLEAKKALLYISQKLNTGTEELHHISKFSTGYENITRLGEFNKATNLVSEDE